MIAWTSLSLLAIIVGRLAVSHRVRALNKSIQEVEEVRVLLAQLAWDSFNNRHLPIWRVWANATGHSFRINMISEEEAKEIERQMGDETP